MEGSRQDEIVIAWKSVEAGMKGAVVDEAAGFVNDQESVYHPVGVIMDDIMEIAQNTYIFGGAAVLTDWTIEGMQRLVDWRGTNSVWENIGTQGVTCQGRWGLEGL